MIENCTLRIIRHVQQDQRELTPTPPSRKTKVAGSKCQVCKSHGFSGSDLGYQSRTIQILTAQWFRKKA